MPTMDPNADAYAEGVVEKVQRAAADARGFAYVHGERDVLAAALRAAYQQGEKAYADSDECYERIGERASEQSGDAAYEERERILAILDRHLMGDLLHAVLDDIEEQTSPLRALSDALVTHAAR